MTGHIYDPSCGRNCSKVDEGSKYTFAFAFENSFAPGYTTEKFYDAFAMDAIPVLLTGPGFERLVPSKGSYISVTDFESPKELAAYLEYVHSNTTLRNSFTMWKKNRTFVRDWISRTSTALPVSLPEAGCALCQAHVRKWGCNLLSPIPEGCPKPSERGGHPPWSQHI